MVTAQYHGQKRSKKRQRAPESLYDTRRHLVHKRLKIFTATYVQKGNPAATITVTTLTRPQQSIRVFRSAGGNRKFKLTKLTSQPRSIIIMAKSAKNKKPSDTDVITDEEMAELEALEGLEDLVTTDETTDEATTDADDSDDLSTLTVKVLRDKAREAGHKVAKLNKSQLIELLEGGATSEDEDEVVEEPKPKKGKKDKEGKKGKKDKTAPAEEPGTKSKKAPASQSKRTDNKVGTQEIATAAGCDARSLRVVLRKLKIEKDEDTQRYEWDSLEDPEVKKIIKAVKDGAVKEANSERLDNLKKARAAKKDKQDKKTKSEDAPKTTKKGKKNKKG